MSKEILLFTGMAGFAVIAEFFALRWWRGRWRRPLDVFAVAVVTGILTQVGWILIHSNDPTEIPPEGIEEWGAVAVFILVYTFIFATVALILAGIVAGLDARFLDRKASAGRKG